MNAEPNIVIADDHEILRDALAENFTKTLRARIVASVGDADSAIQASAKHHPDLLLLDIEMPGRDALASIADVRAASPETKVVILTAFCRDRLIELAIRGGACGYLLKTEAPSALCQMLQQILAGMSTHSESVRARLVDRRRDEAPQRQGAARLSQLTPREAEVLRYIGRGWDNETMARAMHISVRTVERHVARLMDAMQVRDRVALAKLAFDEGLIV